MNQFGRQAKYSQSTETVCSGTRSKAQRGELHSRLGHPYVSRSNSAGPAQRENPTAHAIFTRKKKQSDETIKNATFDSHT